MIKGQKRGAAADWLKFAAAYEGEECLIWPFCRNNKGYGGVLWMGKRRLTHRVICEITNGPPPAPDSQAAHSCGNGHGGCIAPRHLSWKDQSGNERDKIGHGTSNRGGRNGMSVLTEDVVVSILRRRRLGVTYKQLSAEFDVKIQTIASICQRQNWRHVDIDAE